MKIHEHQAKELLAEYGVRVPKGRVAYSVEEAVQAARDLGGSVQVVKAQIHAGGRGKGGGVKLAKSIDEVRSLAEEILGMTLITHQTGPEGKLVRRLYIEEGANIAKEFYLGAVVDRESKCVTFMLSTEGGVDIEEVAANTPEAIVHIKVNPAVGVQSFQIRDAVAKLKISKKVGRSLGKFIPKMYNAFVGLDCDMLEINPLAVDGDDEVFALDAKMSFDSNALYRHPNVVALRDLSEEDPSEVKAAEHSLSYIKLDGNIGCLVNGAGLAMGTMDIIKHYGGEPANFLDVGGSATAERVTEAFRILLADNVKAIFVNIFGGIMQCDTLADGLVTAAKTLSLTVPLIVRMEGTNVEQGRQILADSGLPIINAETMAIGAQKAVAAVKG